MAATKQADKNLSKVKKAVRLLYTSFDTKAHTSYKGAAAKYRCNPLEVILYIQSHELGLPSTREEALEYLRRMDISA